MKKSKNTKLITYTSLIIIIGYFIMCLISYNSYSKIIKDDTLNITKLTAMNIYSEIQNELIKPIFVSLTMANDSFLKNWINNEENENVESITNYLKGIKDKYNYSSTFLVTRESENYYHWDGILKKIKENDAHDVWYYRFLNNNYEYDLDVDTDQGNKNILSVFINCKIRNENDDIIGVTGVGVEMSQIKSILNYYNELLNVDTFLINPEGVIQVHTDESIIEQYNLFEDPEFINSKSKILGNKNDIEVIKISDSIGGYYVTSRYIDELDWYLIAKKDTSALYKSFQEQLLIDLLIATIVIILVIIITGKLIKFHQKRVNILLSTDILTGMKNRRSMDLVMEENIKKFENENKIFSVFILDIDDFKKINDSKGHIFGDEIIKKVAKLAYECIGKNNSICRWGGDEFVGLINDNMSQAIEILEKLERIIAEDKVLSKQHVTISIGIAEYSKGCSIDDILNKADSALYKAKNTGKNKLSF